MEKEVGLIIGDYQIVEILPNSSIKIKCQICGNIKNTKWYNFKKQQNLHEAAFCPNYYKDFENKIYGDFKLITYLGPVWKTHKFKMTCLICGYEKEGWWDDIKNLRNCYHTDCSSHQMYIIKDDSNQLRLFKSRFQDMKNRTTKVNSVGWENYGGRGINSDAYTDFKTFYDDQYDKFLDAYKKFECPSLERVDVNDNYKPDNIIWINFSKQAQNRRNNKWFEAISPIGIKYYSKCQAEFARQHDLNYVSISNYLNGKNINSKGWLFRYLTEEEIKNLKINKE